jgi:hypothetical protein
MTQELESIENELHACIYDQANNLAKIERLTTLKKEAIEKLNLGDIEPEQDGGYQYTIDDDNLMEEIEDIVKKVPKFDKWEDFVKEAIKNTVDFWSKPKKMMAMGVNLWPDFTLEMKDEIKNNVPEFYYQMEEATKKRNEIAEMIQHISSAKAGLSKEEFSVPKNIVLGDAYSLMHQSYNRFFPLKILVTTLALMIKENKTRWINYDEFSKKAFDTALEFSDSLKKIKPAGTKNVKRNERISTGLPISHNLNYVNDRPDWQEKIDKDEKSKQRFFDCYVGPKAPAFQRVINTANQKKESLEVFSGALNETGLVHIQNNDGDLEITLSELGFEFFNLDNPLIDGITIDPKIGTRYDLDKKTNTITTTFSNKEINFIEKKIISRFKLEKIIVKDVLDSLKNKSEVVAEHLDDVIKNTIEKWIIKNKKVAINEKIMTEKDGRFVFDEKKADSYRIATMGRLAEIDKVNWKIKKGKSGNAESFYSINTK